MAKVNVAVIFGGRSGEHEVSLASAANVIAALDKKKFRVIPIGIEKSGRWISGSEALPKLRVAGRLPASAERLLPASPGGRKLLTKNGRAAGRIDVAIPLVHGTYGEDGTLQGLLELAGIPYVGSGVLGSAVGMDKVVQKQLLAAAGLPVAAFVHFREGEWERRKKTLLAEIEEKIGFPCFVKPANMGSSVGISKAHHERELAAAVVEALRYDTKVIVEKAVGRAREIECAVIGDDEPRTSVLGEIVPSNEFYDYEAKYIDGKSELTVPADLPNAVTHLLQQYARRAFLLLNAGGMARVDFLLDGETHEAVINEINTIPGFTDASMFPRLWRASGLSDAQVLEFVIDLALKRADRRQRLRTSYVLPSVKKNS